MIVMRKVCFEHDPFSVKTGADHVVQIGFQLNLYAAQYLQRGLGASRE